MAANTAPTRKVTPLSYLMLGTFVKLIYLGIWLLVAWKWDWFWPWLYTGIFVLYDMVSALVCDPALLAERVTRHRDAKKWDNLYVQLSAGILPLVAGIVAGLDLRFGWGPEVAVTAQWIATGVVALGFAIVAWAMAANAYFSSVVRIQTDRGHQVATGGPYRIVRHPGYVGAMLFTLGLPVMLGSAWGLIPSVIAAILYVLRAGKEDATLQEELPGYQEYAQRTHYRLLPGVW